MEEQSPQIRLAQPRGTVLTNMAVAALIIAALYFGREIFVPFALAVLLSFVLAPFVMRLRTWRIPRTISVLVVVLIGFSIIFSLGGLMVSQATRLAAKLPGYQQTLSDKIESLRGLMGDSGTLEPAPTVLKELKTELQHRDASGRGDGELTRQLSEKPIPVEVRQPDPGALSTLGAIIQPLISPLTTTGVVVIFVVFVLLQREDLRNRLVRLAGSADIQRTTAALDDAGKRLSKLFVTQIAFNAVFGLAIGIGLELIGVPSAPLWGLVAMIMRFVPYIGALISAIFPLILAAAVGSGWQMLILTAALFLVTEAIVGHVIEPLVYGQSTGLSPVAVVASATFWTWLWGPIGLILATPLTICVVVLGRYVDRLKFLDVMFGDEPALTPAELVYQRMLARDPVEAAEQARNFLKQKPLLAYYDEVLVPGLRLAQADAERGLLDDERTLRIRDAVAEIIDDLSTHEDRVEPAAPDETASDEETPLAKIHETEEALKKDATKLPEQWRTKQPVLCIPGLGLLDEAVALMLAQLIERDGIGARVEQADALSISRIFSLDTKDVALVCLCYVETVTSAQVRYALRRLRRKAPDAFILVTMLGASDTTDAREALKDFPKTGLVESLDQTVKQVRAAAPGPHDGAVPLDSNVLA